MTMLKRAVIGTVAALACAGVYSAVINLPVVSGCNFYNDCPDALGVAATKHVDPAATHSIGIDQHD